MTDADRIDRFESTEAIRQLVARYALATDSRDLDALVELFVDDVQVGWMAWMTQRSSTWISPRQ